MAITLVLVSVPMLAGASSAHVTYYAVGRHVCHQPAPGHAACLMMRRVLVSRNTPGAQIVPFAPRSTSGSLTAHPTATIGPAGGLTPSDLEGAYGYDSAATVSGQTVAIVAAFNDPALNADLQTFDTQYGLVTCTTTNGCLRIVNQTGGSALPANDTTGWSAEETLDVETVHAVCQRCKVLLVEATSDAISNLAAAENKAAALGATEISNSYGDAEKGWASVASAYDHPGIVITAGSGDDGYYNFDQLGAGTPAPFNQALAPASFNTVVAVGGTSLFLGQTATRQAETVWNDNGVGDFYEQTIGLPLGATGGGCSTDVLAKGWQKGLGVWASTDCGTHRLVADVAAVADPLTGFDVYDSYACGTPCGTPGWQTAGGTSLASPLVASMFALAGGAHGVAYPALTLYGHLGGTALFDVTSGGDGICGGQGAAQCGNPNTLNVGTLDCDFPATGTTPSTGDRACDALVGFDGPTGVGTPVGLGAFAKIGPKVILRGPTTASLGGTYKWTASVTDPFPGGVIASYTWIWGDGTTTVTSVPSATHVFTKATAKDTITLNVRDVYAQAGTAARSVQVS